MALAPVGARAAAHVMGWLEDAARLAAQEAVMLIVADKTTTSMARGSAQRALAWRPAGGRAAAIVAQPFCMLIHSRLRRAKIHLSSRTSSKCAHSASP